MKHSLLIFLFLMSCYTNGHNLYTKAYGDKTNKAIVFIHGGPSGNSTLFEGTTAQELANKGYYVIIYDRRGEGRSVDSTAKFTYEEAFQDLNKIYETYDLKKATLIGHSFGGLVATLYTQKFPQKVNSLILAGALISQQETYDHILFSVKKTALEKSDTGQLKKIAATENLNKNSAEYRKTCFDLASENGYFKMPNPTVASKKLYSDYEAGTFYKTNIRNKNAPVLFYKNEKQNNIDNKHVLQKIKANGIPVYAIYGQDDAIFSSEQITWIKDLMGKNHFNFIENCSHYLFVDQQEEFLSSVKKWLN